MALKSGRARPKNRPRLKCQLPVVRRGSHPWLQSRGGEGEGEPSCLRAPPGGRGGARPPREGLASANTWFPHAILRRRKVGFQRERRGPAGFAHVPEDTHLPRGRAPSCRPQHRPLSPREQQVALEHACRCWARPGPSGGRPLVPSALHLRPPSLLGVKGDDRGRECVLFSSRVSTTSLQKFLGSWNSGRSKNRHGCRFSYPHYWQRDDNNIVRAYDVLRRDSSFHRQTFIRHQPGSRNGKDSRARKGPAVCKDR